MFGQSSTPFGSPQGGFGQANTTPAFGTPAPAPFGAPAPSFGGGGFGAPAPAPSGFGGFGSPAPAPSGGLFGAPAPAPAFGAPAPAPGGFGSTFGSPAPAPAFGGSTFGAPAPAPFGAPAPAPFGAPAPAPFGAPAPAPGGFGGFGAKPPSSGLFGAPAPAFGAPAPAPSTGLFGAPAPAPGGFGSSGFGSTSTGFGSTGTTGGLFGSSPAPAPAGLFGAPAPAAGGGGTKAFPYQMTSRQDGTSSINLHSITAMSQYESKSFEELRFDDYSQGNRGAQTPTSGGGFGGFGAPAPAPSSGLFGASAPAPAFGAPAPAPGGFGSSFGSPSPAPAFGGSTFGAPAPAPFGAPAPAPFGAPAPAPGAFGFGAKSPAPGGLFGAPSPAPAGGLFGSPAPAPSGGLFGSTPAPAPAFGAPAPAPGLFGAPAPSGGLFGSTPAPAPAFGGSAFGSTPGFGSPAPAPFGAPAPAGGLFGAPAPAPAFGAPASGSLFGAPAPAPGPGLFGAKPPGTSLFGSPAPAPAFGAPPAPSLFGAPAAAPQMPAAPPVGAVMPPAANEILTSQLLALENKRKEIEKSDNFRAKPSESSAVNAVTLSESEALSSLTPVRASYPTYRASPRSNAKVRPRGFASPEKATTPSLSRLGSGGKPMAAPDSLAASSVTRLVINPSPKPKMKLLLDAPSDTKVADPSPVKFPTTAYTSPTVNSHPPLSAKGSEINTPAPEEPSPKTPNGSGAARNYYQQVINSPDEAAVRKPLQESVAPKLTKAGYSCTPSIEKLQSMPPEDLAAVPNFSVEREGVGKIEWEGAVDVRGADLDSVVIIEPSSASVYMKEEEDGDKPPVGMKLNRPAILTMEGVFPSDDGAAAKAKFSRRVEKQTTKMGAELIQYDASIGTWKLRVHHFSRYALTDDDSESEQEGEQDFESGGRGGRSRVVQKGISEDGKDTPSKPKVDMALLPAENEKEGAIVSDVEMSDDLKVLEEAENAFTSMELTLKEGMREGTLPKEDDLPFPEESASSSEVSPKSRFTPSDDDLATASATAGICSSIANEAGIKGSSNIDFGFRMGRSFRCGWSPDGSLLLLKPGGKLVRKRPKFSDSGDDKVKLLEKHQAHSNKVKVDGKCSQFTLPSRKTSPNQLQTTLKAYSEDGDEMTFDSETDVSISKQAFSLIKCLLETNETSTNDQLMALGDTGEDTDTLEERRVYSVLRWLVNSCSKEVDVEILEAKRGGRNYEALLAAASSGDIEKTCIMAQEIGHLQLATMLASGPEGRADTLKAILSWKESGTVANLPQELTRIYFLIAGDSKMEEKIYRQNNSSFDWRRRLAMQLTYTTPKSKQSLGSIIREYEENLARGVAPYPQPQYLSGGSREEIQCLLYRLLKMGKHKLEMSLREVIDPIGHTNVVHDFSLSFHLAAAISALGCSVPLTPIEEQNLIDGYIAQLVTSGHWQWAVYVSLCLLESSTANDAAFKKQRAKSLVTRNYGEDVYDAEGRRSFLESIGVPPEWFEEALALRCSANGDAYGYLNHMVKVSTEETCVTLEQILIPNMLFMNKDKLAGARRILEVFSVDEGTLVFAVFNFFQIYENILLLEGASRAEIDSALPDLLETCESVEKVFAAYRSGEEKLQGPALRMIPDTNMVPMASFLAEGLSQVSLFKLQLRALQSGISLSSTASQILNLTQPVDLKESGIAARENICRWFM